MIRYGKRFLIITAVGLMFVFAAQLISRNFYLASSVEYSSETARQDSLARTRQALISRIAVLESPSRLMDIGAQMGLSPLPLEHFMLLEVNR